MGPQVFSVTPGPTLPPGADVGTSAALHLARRGLEAAPCEEGHARPHRIDARTIAGI